jgi:hypothetical protein
MNNTIISTVAEHKHLGLQLSDDGNWNKHIDMITKKAFKIESFYAFPFYLSIFPTWFQYIDYLRIQVWYPQSRF